MSYFVLHTSYVALLIFTFLFSLALGKFQDKARVRRQSEAGIAMNQQYGSNRRYSIDQDSEAFFDDHLYFEVHDVRSIIFLFNFYFSRNYIYGQTSLMAYLHQDINRVSSFSEVP